MSAAHASSWRKRWWDCIATLYPGYFALVMATGIIANAMLFEGQRSISDGLLGISLIAYVLIIAMTLVRIVRFPRAVWHDLTEPQIVFAFFTIVAATDVVGVGLNLRGFALVALALWIAALL